MNDFADKALLPAGMCDVLPPDAESEAAASEGLLACFAARGYDRVKPPLIEFEESLLGGGGSTMSAQTFRLMDPVSQRMMGVRADMTLQVARIATTRMKKFPRPLRLSYGGQVLRVRGTQMRPERQFGQVGAELLGSPEPRADAEVIVMAVRALERLGIKALSIDLALPTLVPAIIAGLDLDGGTMAALRAALERKDEAAVGGLSERLGGMAGGHLIALLRATGTAGDAMAALDRLELAENAAAERAALAGVIDEIRAVAPRLSLTVDPVESRGLEYHSGVTFTIFATGVRGELGGGGRYIADGGEPATGMTLFMDTVLRAMPGATDGRRIYLDAAADGPEAGELRAAGWITIAGLDEGSDPAKEAGRLGCTHYFRRGKIVGC